MDCPACKSAMITLELAEVEIDHCIRCGGIWLDAGELELLIQDSSKARDLLASFQEDAGPPTPARKCPICDRKMARIMAGRSKPPVLIDKCRRSDGLWFDRDELQSVLRLGQLDEGGRIQRLLADMFAGPGERTEVQPGS